MLIDLTTRALWTTAHGVVLGGLFILSLALVLWSLPLVSEPHLSEGGAEARLRWLRWGLLVMTGAAWAAVIIGTFVIDPWYHEHVPTSALTLLDKAPGMGWWTDIVMEWKERISWTAALFATAAAYIVVYQRSDLLWSRPARRTAFGLFGVAFGAALCSGLMGMLLTKVAPVT